MCFFREEDDMLTRQRCHGWSWLDRRMEDEGSSDRSPLILLPRLGGGAIVMLLGIWGRGTLHVFFESVSATESSVGDCESALFENNYS